MIFSVALEMREKEGREEATLIEELSMLICRSLLKAYDLGQKSGLSSSAVTLFSKNEELVTYGLSTANGGKKNTMYYHLTYYRCFSQYTCPLKVPFDSTD